MAQNPLVSIIIPCYNYGHLINQTLESVRSQSYENWECIVVDDGSQDNSGEIIQETCKLDSRFTYVHQLNTGLSGARNTGLKKSSGDYIQFLDADDLLSPNKLSINIAIMQENPEIDLVFGNAHLFYDGTDHLKDSTRFELMSNPISGRGQRIIEQLLSDNMFLVHCALFKVSIYKEVGSFNENFITCEDWNFWFRVALSNKYFHYLPSNDAIVYIRHHGNNMSSAEMNMWTGKKMFYALAQELLGQFTNYGKLEDVQWLIAKSKTGHALYSYRLNIRYQNLFKWLYYFITYVLLSKKLLLPIRESIYLFKQRIFNYDKRAN